ncbi:MAG: hypothetical protein ACTSRP_07790 [Candidatus Helarchaeota archaeon]
MNRSHKEGGFLGTQFEILDIFIILIAIGYVMVIVILGDIIQKKTKVADFSRKFIHIFAGFSALSTFFLNWHWLADFIALLFVIMIYLANPKSSIKFLKKMFNSMARDEDKEQEHIWGPFYYAISILILTFIFTFPNPSIDLVQYYIFPSAALSIMYIGDGLAPIIGKKFGKKEFKFVKGAIRTIPGSLTLLITGFLSSSVILIIFGVYYYQLLSIYSVMIISLIGSICATFIEMFSPKGLDNLFLPLLTAPILMIIYNGLQIIGI